MRRIGWPRTSWGKFNAVDPQTYLADALTRLVNRHPASQIDQLMPWAYANEVA